MKCEVIINSGLIQVTRTVIICFNYHRPFSYVFILQNTSQISGFKIINFEEEAENIWSKEFENIACSIRTFDRSICDDVITTFGHLLS